MNGNIVIAIKNRYTAIKKERYVILNVKIYQALYRF